MTTASITENTARSRPPATFDGHLGLLVFLEDLLGRRVDVVTAKGLRNEGHTTVSPRAGSDVTIASGILPALDTLKMASP